MDKENIIIISLIVIICFCIIGGVLYLSLSHTDNTPTVTQSTNTSTVSTTSDSSSSSSDNSNQVSSSSSSNSVEDDFGKYDSDDYIYDADGQRMYWVQDDGYDGSYMHVEDTNGAK